MEYLLSLMVKGCGGRPSFLLVKEFFFHIIGEIWPL
jgi:hypothetical protein